MMIALPSLRILVIPVFFFFIVLLKGVLLTGIGRNERGFMDLSSLSYVGDSNYTLKASHRKLLIHRELEPTRMWGDRCTKSDIVINQGPTAPLPTGIPTYTVEIMNVCVTGCDISRIHLTCGWFSSAHLINPKIFKRLRFNDCLVNDGKPLVNGGTLSFQYANTFLYPLSVSSVVCN